MARSGGAWSVKGIDQATRDIAKRAAQASGLTIGEWIDRAILEDARAKGVTVHRSADDGSAGDVGAGSGAGSGGRSARDVSPGGISREALETLYKRLEQSDSRIDEALRPIAYTLHDIASRLVTAEKAAGSGPGSRTAAGVEEIPRFQETPRLQETPPVPVEGRVEDEEPRALGGPAADTLPAAPPATWSPDAPSFEGLEAGAAEVPEAPVEAPAARPGDHLAARARARPISRPVPQPPSGDFPADLSGLAPSDPSRLAPGDSSSRAPVEPDHPRQAHRPNPVPPTGDFVPDSLEPGLPPPGTVVSRIDTGRVRGFEPTPALTAGRSNDAALSEAVGADLEGQFQPDAQTRPRSKRRVGVAASLAMALVLLIATLAGSWWFATGGRFEGTDRMIAGLGDRLSEAGGSVVESAEAVWHGVSQLAEATLEDLEGPEAPETPMRVEPAPAQPVPAPSAPQEAASQGVAPTQVEPVQPETAQTAPEAPSEPQANLSEGPATPETVPAAPAPVASVEPVRPAPVPSAPVPAAPAVTPSPAPSNAPSGTPSGAPSGASSDAPSTADSLQAFPTSGETAANEAAQNNPESKTGTDAASEQVAVAAPTPSAPAPSVATPTVATPSAATPSAALLAQARGGDARAQHELATLLIAGDPSQAENAANWFREAAIQGLPNAQYNLGVLYERGLGVREDETRALLWYHSAAEQGHPLAQYNLGVLYAAGRGVPLSYAEAAYWFEQAAERGVPAAAYNLGVLVEGGLGRTRDMEAARAWYEKARELGHVGAGQRLAGERPNSNGDGLLDRPQTTSDAIALGAEDIALIQQRLADLGLYEGAVDGIAGARTQAAISRYQAANGLPVTGLASAMLLQRLQ